ncbi:MAG TPA: hypothetical protein VEX35_09265 [Allosphingosinicella sp.]|nr:hypothetical protein [Allosphingosinicella sp.]
MTDYTLGGGAQFYGYISPVNETASKVTKWSITVSQGDWSGEITSVGTPLKTDNLSGIFQLVVMGSGPDMPWQQLKPQPTSSTDIGCNPTCYSMISIVADEDGSSATYVTTWDAACLMGKASK